MPFPPAIISARCGDLTQEMFSEIQTLSHYYLHNDFIMVSNSEDWASLDSWVPRIHFSLQMTGMTRYENFSRQTSLFLECMFRNHMERCLCFQTTIEISYITCVINLIALIKSKKKNPIHTLCKVINGALMSHFNLYIFHRSSFPAGKKCMLHILAATCLFLAHIILFLWLPTEQP